METKEAEPPPNPTYSGIASDTQCECLTQSEINITDQFVRKLRKEQVTDLDFKSHWERGIRNTEECEDVCGLKGISVDRFSDDAIDAIVAKYKTTFNINPKKGAHYLKFKFNDRAGLVKKTPGIENDENHYDFYKSDEFVMSCISVAETVKFA